MLSEILERILLSINFINRQQKSDDRISINEIVTHKTMKKNYVNIAFRLVIKIEFCTLHTNNKMLSSIKSFNICLGGDYAKLFCSVFFLESKANTLKPASKAFIC